MASLQRACGSIGQARPKAVRGPLRQRLTDAVLRASPHDGHAAALDILQKQEACSQWL